tara:strand:- start:16407 stop:17408 length:1002 start_codon:yes stop_codon:yes gene_type:complete
VFLLTSEALTPYASLRKQMIEIRNLYKRYHNHHGSDWVLKDINLTIPKGVSVGLIGANGAGKSTLLRLIAGMDSPERGEVIRHSRVSWPVGLAGGMQNNMTGRQNVKFVARVQGSSPKEVQRVIQFVEEFAEIGEAFDEPVRTYSSGMRSRISFGLSLAFDFDIYISDEATAVGDRAFKEKAKALFQSKVGEASLIMVSHSEGILKDLCSAGLYLNEGTAHWYDNIKDAIKAYHDDIDKHKAVSTVEEVKQPEPVSNIDSSLPQDIAGAEKHLQQCRVKLKEAKRSLDIAKAEKLLPLYQHQIAKDIPKRERQVAHAIQHLEALKQASSHVEM